MSDPNPGLPPAGWYPDPGGEPQQRWWDGFAWTDTLQPNTPAPVAAQAAAAGPVISVPAIEPPVVEPPVTSQPLTFVASPSPTTAPTVYPFAQVSAGGIEAVEPAASENHEPARPAGRLHFLALLAIGLATSVGGIALFTYGTYGVTDTTLAAQNQLYGGVVAGFGAFAMLLWLAAGAIRQR